MDLKRWTNCLEDWENLISRKKFLKLNIAAISRWSHRGLFLTCELQLHEIIDEYEEIFRFLDNNEKRYVTLLKEPIVNERKFKKNKKQYRYHIVLEVSKIYKVVALREETSQNTPYISHVLRINSNTWQEDCRERTTGQ